LKKKLSFGPKHMTDAIDKYPGMKSWIDDDDDAKETGNKEVG